MVLGRRFITDYEPLEIALKDLQTDKMDVKTFERLFPGWHNAVVECLKELDNRNLRAGTIVYFNFRLQAWAANGFDAEPSSTRRVIPFGVVTEEDASVH